MLSKNKNIQSLTNTSNFKEVFHDIGIGIMGLKEDMYIKFINLEALSIFGYQLGELDKIKLPALFHKSCQKKLKNIFKRIMEKAEEQGTIIIDTGGKTADEVAKELSRLTK